VCCVYTNYFYCIVVLRIVSVFLVLFNKHPPVLWRIIESKKFSKQNKLFNRYSIAWSFRETWKVPIVHFFIHFNEDLFIIRLWVNKILSMGTVILNNNLRVFFNSQEHFLHNLQNQMFSYFICFIINYQIN